MIEKKKKKPTPKPVIQRKNRVTIGLNDKELEFMDNYFRKYKISNKARWMRETIILTMYKQLDKDAPTLFDDI